MAEKQELLTTSTTSVVRNKAAHQGGLKRSTAKSAAVALQPQGSESASSVATGSSDWHAVETYVESLRGIPGVEYAIAKMDGGVALIEVAANHISLDDRDRVYDAQLTIANRYPEVRWDFRVTDRKDTPLDASIETYRIFNFLSQPA